MINRVLLYNSGGGIGDAIQILPLINGLKSEFKNAVFYYLCSHENHFNSSLRDLNCNIDTLSLNIKYFGFRWWHLLAVKKNIKKLGIERFDLIIDLQSKIRNSLILKRIPHKIFVSSCFNFRLSKPNLKIDKKSSKINDNILKALNIALKTNIKLIDYNINKIDKKFYTESNRLLPEKNYVGFSITQGNIYRKKEWPFANIIKIAKTLKENNKIPVFFIEKKNHILKDKIKEKIPFAKFPEHESELSSPSLVVCLAKKLDFAITIDNGIMHMLSLAKIPLIVLFGPTDPNKFAPNHKNTVILDSKKIYKTKNISSISSEDVLQAAMRHSNFLN